MNEDDGRDVRERTLIARSMVLQPRRTLVADYFLPKARKDDPRGVLSELPEGSKSRGVVVCTGRSCVSDSI